MKNRKFKMLFLFLIALSIILSFTSICFADVGDDIAKGITTAIVTVRKIINPIATIAVIGCGVYCIMGSDPAMIKRAKAWGIAIFIGLILINLAGPIVDWASSIGK